MRLLELHGLTGAGVFVAAGATGCAICGEWVTTSCWPHHLGDKWMALLCNQNPESFRECISLASPRWFAIARGGNSHAGAEFSDHLLICARFSCSGLASKSGQPHVVSPLRRPRMPYAVVVTTWAMPMSPIMSKGKTNRVKNLQRSGYLTATTEWYVTGLTLELDGSINPQAWMSLTPAV